MRDWLTWLGRGAEKERAYGQLARMQERYSEQGERVIRLSRRTELARKMAGSTRQAFGSVESAFARATGEYARVGELIGHFEVGLGQGRVGDWAAIDHALAALGPSLDQLEQHLTTWEQTWETAPRRIDEAQLFVAELRQQVERASAVAGAPLPPAEQLAGLQAHLERIRQTLAGGNPIEANHQVDDLLIAGRRVRELAEQYLGAAGAITQAEQELAQARLRLTGVGEPPAEAIAALAAAEALLPRLRPALAAGRLESLQQELLQLQRHLATARTALR